MTKRAGIFDLDGSLIECGQYYIETNQKGAAYLAEHTGLAHEACLAIMAQTDLAACALPNAFKSDRYPRSFAAAAMAACHIAAPTRPQLVPYATHMYAMEQIGRSVFDAPYVEYPGVKPMLEQLRADGWTLILFTKGDSEVQTRKINLHGYPRYFDHCIVTLEKSTAHVQRLIRDFDIDPAQSFYAGDSMKDDILPAKAAGLKAIHVTPKTHWAYDNEATEPDATVALAADVPSVLDTLFRAEAPRG